LEGKMEEFKSGARRSERKPRYKLGAELYGEYNWQKGLPAGDTINHVIEHLLIWQENLKEGIEYSEDDLAAAAWGCFALMWLEENGRLIGDAKDTTTKNAQAVGSDTPLADERRLPSRDLRRGTEQSGFDNARDARFSDNPDPRLGGGR
jgi:hypothetical protein